MNQKVTLHQWSIYFFCRYVRVRGTIILSKSKSAIDSGNPNRTYTTKNIIRRISNNKLIDDNLTMIVLIGDCVKNNDIPDFFNDTYKNGFPVLWKNYMFLWKIYSDTKDTDCFDFVLSKQKSLEMQPSNTNTTASLIEKSKDVDTTNDKIVFELNFQCSKAKSVQNPLSSQPIVNKRVENNNNPINCSTPIKRSSEVSVLGRTNAKTKAHSAKSKSTASEMSDVRSKSNRDGSATTLSESFDDSVSGSSDESDDKSSDENDTESVVNDRGSRRQSVAQRTASKKSVREKNGGKGNSGRKAKGIVCAETVATRENNENRKKQVNKQPKQRKSKQQVAGNSRGDSSPQKAIIDGVNNALKKLSKRSRKRKADSGDTETAATANTIAGTSKTKIRKTDGSTSAAVANDDGVFKKPLHPAPRNSMSTNSTNSTSLSVNNSTFAKKRFSESNSSQNTTSQRRRKLHTMGSNSQIMLG